MDLYRPVLEKILFPVLEAAQGRTTAPLLQFLAGSEHWSLDALRELQSGLLRRLIRHAASHTAYYRQVLDDRRLSVDDFATVEDVRKLPVLDRDAARATTDARTAALPRWTIEASVVDPSGAPLPLIMRSSAEAPHWRDAVRWRGHGWAGYRPGMRALHYICAPRDTGGWWSRRRRAFDRAVQRELVLDCVVRSEPALARAVDELRRFAPEVIVADADGIAALARFVRQHELRAWNDVPVIATIEAPGRLWPHDRAAIESAFGPVFAAYQCREVGLIGAECERHDGIHTAMENLIVELVVRTGDGQVRAARPGEIGEVAVTDLHDLACPLIRYLTGERAIARPETRCACGRGLATFGPIDGQVSTEYVDEISLGSGGRRQVVAAAPAAARAVMLA